MKKIIGVGLGLIGGSMLLSLKEIFPQATYSGVDTKDNHLKEAIHLNLIQAEATPLDFEKADLVIVSIPVDIAPKVVKKYLKVIGPDTLIIDTGSTKEGICKAVATHPNRHQYLAAHPIAGTEFSGPQAAIPSLFKGKTMIICDIEKTDTKLQNVALEIFSKMGMKLRFMNPKAHDIHMAYVSHLSHISSFMLGKTVIDKEEDERNIFDLAGSGFESTVRLAKSNPDTWVPIFKKNKTFVVEALSKYISNLQNFKSQLETEKYDDVLLQLKNTNRLKHILNGIHKHSKHEE